jgi:glycosyltransferase involved in cell wall biosynthesis
MHASRPDLRSGFPDIEGSSFGDFCTWVETFGRYELKIDDVFLRPIFDPVAGASNKVGPRQHLQRLLKRTYDSAAGLGLRRLAKRWIGVTKTEVLRRRFKGERSPASRPRDYRLGMPRALDNLGVNLVGYLQAETGMGEAARSLARALQTTELPLSLHSVTLGVRSRQEDTSFTAQPTPYEHDVNLLVINADQTLPVYEELGAEVFAGRYNIGFWLWELETFPSRWRPAFDVLHEIWTPSTFCVDALSAVAPIPVRRVPIPVQAPPRATHGRAHFGLPEEAFIFLFNFSFLSFAQRKNPLGLVRAFKRAFRSGEGPLLVLKSSGEETSPKLLASLEREIGGADVRLIEGYIDRDAAHSLTAACDCYVSLHRSEGFGLTLAEAMIAGKPVIATPYSGVSDFFDLNTGYPVRYTLVEIEKDVGPYPAGAVWAEPDIEHAAELMRRVFVQREEASEVGRRGQELVRSRLSAEAVGGILAKRFDAAISRANSNRL